MVKHIVLWRLEEVAEGASRAENAKRIKEGLEKLNGQVDGLVKLEIGRNISAKGFDLALYAELTSQDALENLWSDPAFLKMRDYIRKVITDRVSVDYEV